MVGLNPPTELMTLSCRLAYMKTQKIRMAFREVALYIFTSSSIQFGRKQNPRRKRKEHQKRKAVEEKDTVLDGLYSWDEYVYLKKSFPELILVCVCCDKKKRYERIAVRPFRPFNSEEIVTRDVSEIENLAKGGPIAYADYYILNNGDKDGVILRLVEILKKL